MKHSRTITLLMLLGLVLGGLFGVIIHDDLSAGTGFFPRAVTWLQTVLGIEPVAKSGQFTFHWLRDAGTFILIRPLMLLIIPLVFVSVTLGMASIGDPTRLGLIGGATLVFFLTSMALAATLGAVTAVTLKPGQIPTPAREALIASADADLKASDAAGIIQAAQSAGRSTPGGAWRNLLDQLVPTNIVREMSEGRILGVFVFAALLGLALPMGGEKSASAVKAFAAINDAIMRIVGWIMWAAPLGVFLLVSWSIGRIGLEALAGPLARVIGVACAAMAFHALIVLPVILVMFGRTNPVTFAWRCRKALLTAFGTSSSSAALPVTLETCVNDGGCSRRAASFVVPLGSAVNVNGTALFETLAVVILCQLYGIDLTANELVFVVTTAVLTSIGTAGLPAAGPMTMLIVINAVNTTLVSNGKTPLPASAMGVIVGVDRILDMCRTTLNVWGDMVGARIITRIAPDESNAP